MPHILHKSALGSSGTPLTDIGFGGCAGEERKVTFHCAEKSSCTDGKSALNSNNAAKNTQPAVLNYFPSQVFTYTGEGPSENKTMYLLAHLNQL